MMVQPVVVSSSPTANRWEAMTIIIIIIIIIMILRNTDCSYSACQSELWSPCWFLTKSPRGAN